MPAAKEKIASREFCNKEARRHYLSVERRLKKLEQDGVTGVDALTIVIAESLHFLSQSIADNFQPKG